MTSKKLGRPRLPALAGLFCRRCGDENIAKDKDKAVSGKQRFRCRSCGSRMTTPFKEKPQLLPKFKKFKAERYIITSAMSETYIEPTFWGSLLKMAGELDARLIVLGTVEKNPNLMTRGSPLKYPDEVLPYICRERFQITPSLVARGDFSIEHSVINPLAGANHCGGMQTEIFGHAQVALEMVPTPKNLIPKALYTTGTVSTPNYSHAARAKKAEFHHSYAALFVEVSGSRFWPTHLRYDKQAGGVEFLGKIYTPKRVRKAPPLAGIVYGDIHRDILTKPEEDAFWRLCNGARALKNVICDVVDGHTFSHHTEADVLHKMRSGNFDIEGELNRAAKFVSRVPNCVVVSSNHHDHLDKWYNRQDPRRMTYYLPLYQELTKLAVQYPEGDLFRAWCLAAGVKAEFTHPNHEYDIQGTDVSQHGHIGPNGARGSRRGFARTGRKTMIQHSHTPGADKGCMQVGTSSMHHAYALGYSSWAVAHGIITHSGKRSLLFAIKNRYSPLTERWLSERKPRR